MVVGAATLGILVEHKKLLGKISGILVTMILMSLLSMFGVVPVASNSKVIVPVYDMVFSYFMPISIPMLLLSTNITKIIKESGKLLLAFLLGAVGIVIGCIIAFFIIDLGGKSAETAGVIAATLIGGSVNFVATAEILNFSTNPLFTTTVAIDNFVANLYILFLFTVPTFTFLAKFFVKHTEVETNENKIISEDSGVSKSITFEKIAYTIFLSVFIAVGGNAVAPYLENFLHTTLSLRILIITVLAILIANIFPKKLKEIESTSFSVGLWLMYIFLAVIGAATNLNDILNVGLNVLLFYLIIMFVHFVFLIAVAKLFKLNVFEVIISSAANIMGPSVAAPMAASLGQQRMVTPAILVGILGYIIGTFIGVSIASLL